MSIWTELDLTPTADIARIRQAFAARREAATEADRLTRLDAALAVALIIAPRRAAGDAPALDPKQPAPPGAAARSAEAGGAIERIGDALARGEGAEAAQLLLQASRDRQLPLAMESALRDRLAAVLLDDTSLRAERLLAIAQQFGWFDAANSAQAAGDTPQALLRQRIARELAAQRPANAPMYGSQSGPTRPERGDPVWPILIAGLVFAGIALLGFVGLSVYLNWNESGEADKEPIAVVLTHPERIDSPNAECRKGFVTPEELAAQPVEALQRCATRSSGAANALGLRYLKGEGVKQDYVQAAALFKNAADEGQTQARRNLAQMLRAGQGVAKDPAEARSLYQHGADLGDLSAAQSLAEMMASGEGGPADPEGAFRWIKSAAFGKQLPAMTRLGDFYARGFGTAQNPVKAAAWRKAAAHAGDAQAMQSYGVMALRGDGMSVDMAEAYRWLSLAARYGQPSPAELAQATRALSPDARGAIDRELRSWQAMAAVAPIIDSRY